VSLHRSLQPLRFRAFELRDLEACLALFRSNADQFPCGYENTFESALRVGASLYLVGEEAGRIVTCGGVAYHDSYDHAWLSFGIVDAARQRRGIGTTLLFARLALLEPDAAGCLVSLRVTAYSFPFFRRFGFEGYETLSDAHGNPLATFCRLISAEEVAQCRAHLARAGAVLPTQYEIPVRDTALPTGEAPCTS
jgi:GNAT superfamily N-acetyltransferase